MSVSQTLDRLEAEAAALAIPNVGLEDNLRRLKAWESRLLGSAHDPEAMLDDITTILQLAKPGGRCRCDEHTTNLADAWYHGHHGRFNRVVHETLIAHLLRDPLYKQLATDLAVRRPATWRDMHGETYGQQLLSFFRPDAERFGWFVDAAPTP
jgi:hypothetical protein